MSEVPLISVCVPTYRRPVELKEALLSILEQSQGDFEILVGDDSPELHHEVFREIQDPRVRRFPHSPGLGQISNVCSLLEQVRGQFLVLLHDDDLLLPGALQAMSDVLTAHADVDAVFGMQIPQESEGALRMAQIESFNADFGRRAEVAGRVDPAVAGLSRMFPNDGWMVRSELARQVGYQGHSKHYPDFIFGVRLGLQAKSFWFLAQTISTYRFTAISISNSGNRESGTWEFLHRLEIPPVAQAAHVAIRGVFCRIEAVNAALRREPLRALSMWAHPDFGAERWGARGFKLVVACFVGLFPVAMRPKRWR